MIPDMIIFIVVGDSNINSALSNTLMAIMHHATNIVPPFR